jgi:hypothetical protein
VLANILSWQGVYHLRNKGDEQFYNCPSVRIFVEENPSRDSAYATTPMPYLYECLVPFDIKADARDSEGATGMRKLRIEFFPSLSCPFEHLFELIFREESGLNVQGKGLLELVRRCVLRHEICDRLRREGWELLPQRLPRFTPGVRDRRRTLSVLVDHQQLPLSFRIEADVPTIYQVLDDSGIHLVVFRYTRIRQREACLRQVSW